MWLSHGLNNVLALSSGLQEQYTVKKPRGPPFLPPATAAGRALCPLATRVPPQPTGCPRRRHVPSPRPDGKQHPKPEAGVEPRVPAAPPGPAAPGPGFLPHGGLRQRLQSLKLTSLTADVGEDPRGAEGHTLERRPGSL